MGKGKGGGVKSYVGVDSLPVMLEFAQAVVVYPPARKYRLQLKRGLFSYFFKQFLQKLRKFIWFLIDID